MKHLNSILLACAALLTPSIALADVVTDWNTIAISTVAADAVVNRQTRHVAMVHSAMFDAMNGIRREYTSAMVNVHGKGYASREAAGAQAAHDVLVALFPAKATALAANLAATLNQIPADPEKGKRPKAEGIAVGKAAAAAVLAIRQNDKAFGPLQTFTSTPGAGNYQPTGGTCTTASLSVPHWGTVTPFTSGTFTYPARPSVGDSQWLTDLSEVQSYGRNTSTVRTPAQTSTALFFMEVALTATNRLARALIAQEPAETQHSHADKQLLAHARLFANLNLSQAETYIYTWQGKYGEAFWRPITAINAMFPGSNWAPLRATPCHPEYLAAHGTLTPAGITALQNYFGDAVNVNVTSTSLVGATRNYTSLEQVISDVNDARVFLGVHYRGSMTTSNVLGRAVANFVNDNLMLPIDNRTNDDSESAGSSYRGQSVSDDHDGAENDD